MKILFDNSRKYERQAGRQAGNSGSLLDNCLPFVAAQDDRH
jgi:hypothetical protein